MPLSVVLAESPNSTRATAWHVNHSGSAMSSTPPRFGSDAKDSSEPPTTLKRRLTAEHIGSLQAFLRERYEKRHQLQSSMQRDIDAWTDASLRIVHEKLPEGKSQCATLAHLLHTYTSPSGAGNDSDPRAFLLSQYFGASYLPIGDAIQSFPSPSKAAQSMSPFLRRLAELWDANQTCQEISKCRRALQFAEERKAAAELAHETEIAEIRNHASRMASQIAEQEREVQDARLRLSAAAAQLSGSSPEALKREVEQLESECEAQCERERRSQEALRQLTARREELTKAAQHYATELQSADERRNRALVHLLAAEESSARTRVLAEARDAYRALRHLATAERTAANERRVARELHEAEDTLACWKQRVADPKAWDRLQHSVSTLQHQLTSERAAVENLRSQVEDLKAELAAALPNGEYSMSESAVLAEAAECDMLLPQKYEELDALSEALSQRMRLGEGPPASWPQSEGASAEVDVVALRGQYRSLSQQVLQLGAELNRTLEAQRTEAHFDSLSALHGLLVESRELSDKATSLRLQLRQADDEIETLRQSALVIERHRAEMLAAEARKQDELDHLRARLAALEDDAGDVVDVVVQPLVPDQLAEVERVPLGISGRRAELLSRGVAVPQASDRSHSVIRVSVTPELAEVNQTSPRQTSWLWRWWSRSSPVAPKVATNI